MNEMLGQLLAKLKSILKILFMRIGEEKLSDGGVGPYIISELLMYLKDNFLSII